MGILQAILKEVRAIDPHPGVKAFLQDPPSPDPVNPDAYIILDGATGDWNGHDDEVARWDTIQKVWRFDDFSAANTHIARVEDPGGLWYYDASASEWVQFTLIGGVLHTLSNAVPLAAHFGTGSPGTSIAGSRSDHVHDLGAPNVPQPTGPLSLVGTGNSPAKDDHVHAHGDLDEHGGYHALTTDSNAGFFSPSQKAQLEATGPLTIAVDPEALSLDTVATIGAATEGARADHVHEVLAPSSQPTAVGGTQPSIGTSAASARADHVHPITTGLSQTVGQGNDQGSGTAIALANHIHAHGQQLADGDAHTNATTSTDGFQSKADKTKLDAAGVLGTTIPPAVNAGTGSAGNSSEAARANHTHDVSASTASPVSVHSSSGTAGSQNTLARSDHRHAHANLSGGALHALATSNAHGFLSKEDKAKLDNIRAATQFVPLYGNQETGTSSKQLASFGAYTAFGENDWTVSAGSDYVTAKRAGTYKISATFSFTRYQAITDSFSITLSTSMGDLSDVNVTCPAIEGSIGMSASMVFMLPISVGTTIAFNANYMDQSYTYIQGRSVVLIERADY